jgi:16S rRNA (cytosine967-C5)-methyltransferase
VVATELKRDRIPRLRETIARVAPSASIVNADATAPPLAAESVDVALVDAPCSATGTLARHPDGRWRLTERSIERSAELQQQLLAAAAVVVRVEGVLVYATCSLEPEENQQLVSRFLEVNRAYRRECDDLFLFPPETGTDGAFAARLRRVG